MFILRSEKFFLQIWYHTGRIWQNSSYRQFNHLSWNLIFYVSRLLPANSTLGLMINSCLLKCSSILVSSQNITLFLASASNQFWTLFEQLNLAFKCWFLKLNAPPQFMFSKDALSNIDWHQIGQIPFIHLSLVLQTSLADIFLSLSISVSFYVSPFDVDHVLVEPRHFQCFQTSFRIPATNI